MVGHVTYTVWSYPLCVCLLPYRTSSPCRCVSILPYLHSKFSPSVLNVHMLSDQPRLLPPPPSIHCYHARSFTLSLFCPPAVSRCFVLIICFIICLVHATGLYFTDWITTGRSHYS